ncbi:MAG: hypothetical protein JRI54_11825 [Deltaproteobacteria bacterium]|nr:hypothetical protein [Deltaproteobacteria bacterium]
MNTKVCTRCGEAKPLSEFHRNARSKDGLHSYCKRCNKEKAAAYLKTDKGKASIKKAISRAADKGYYRYGKGAIPILRQAAKKRGIAFDLTVESLEEWWHITPDRCFYCGMTIEEYLRIRDFILSYSGNNFEISKFKRFYRSPKHQAIRWMTIDRKRNDIGYSVDNIVKCCWICNSLKNDFFDAEQMKNISSKLISKLRSEIEKEKA